MSEALAKGKECPVGNYCAITVPQDGLACGESEIEHLDPLKPAESICMHALNHAAQNKVSEIHSQANNLKVEFARTADLSWYGTELALNEGATTEGLAQLAQADSLAKNVMDQNQISVEVYHRAALLHSYVPLFQSRIQNIAPTLIETEFAKEELCKMYLIINNAPLHTLKTHGPHYEDPNHHPCVVLETDAIYLKTKLALFLLASRAGIVLYPSSYREMHLKSADIKLRKHEMYYFDGKEKYPIKISSGNYGFQRGYESTDTTMLGVSMTNIIIKAYEFLGKTIGFQEADRLRNEICDLIYYDASGVKLDDSLNSVLDAVTTQFKAKIQEYVSQYSLNVYSEVSAQSEKININWTIFPPGHFEKLRSHTTSANRTGNYERRVDLKRIEQLEKVLTDWGDGYIAVANLTQSGTFDYVVAVLKDTLKGRPVEHAIAENPGVGNAMFVFRAENGFVNGDQILTWKEAFAANKKDAVELGARRIVHTVNADLNLLEFITRPSQAFNS